MTDITQLFCASADKANDSALARALLQYAFRESFGSDAPAVEKTPQGKPFFPSRPDVYFSLSHSRSHVLCAFGDFPVGTDIETFREVSARVPGRICSAEELGQFDFFELWTLKESYFKLLGGGLFFGNIVFSRIGDDIVSPDPLVHSRLYRDIPGSTAAVCSYDCALPEKIWLVPSENLRKRS